MAAVRIRRRGLLVGVVAVLMLAGVGLTAGRAAAGSSGPHYRLATATVGSVAQTISGVGTVGAVNRATVSFPVAGAVAAVRVGIGTKVEAGQVLASLDASSLNQQLTAAQAALAGAQQTLASDEASQTATATTAALRIGSGEQTASLVAVRIGRPSAAPTGALGPLSGSGSLTTLAAKVSAAQQAVLTAQQALDADLTAAENALADCQEALTPTLDGSPSASPTGSATGPAATSPAPTSAAPTSAAPTSPAATSSAPTGSDDGAAQCLAAIGQAPDRAAVAADERARGNAERSLDSAIAELAAAAKKAGLTGAGSSGKTSAGSGSTRGGSTGAGSSRSAGSGSSGSGSFGGGSGNSTGSGTGSGLNRSGGPASAEQLAADQAKIDADRAELAVAQQDLAAAILTSPLDGTVAAVSLTAGKTVGASSSSAGITVIGAGAEQVSTTVGLADIDSVHPGDPASVRVDGIGTPLTGTVSLVGILNTTSGSSTSYPVTIVLNPTSARLYDGSGATVQIQVAAVSGVLTVPSSAVHSFGQLHTVEVLTNGKPVQTRVTVGAVGSERTQISAGLKAGQQVVLADLAEPLPTSG
jgi:multidrug efflux pump subunit AcrA (membrane-fusion protein)